MSPLLVGLLLLGCRKAPPEAPKDLQELSRYLYREWQNDDPEVMAAGMDNLHAFLNIVTNHAGDDLYRFQAHCKPKSGTFYLRQVISSVNFRTGAPQERQDSVRRSPLPTRITSCAPQ